MLIEDLFSTEKGFYKCPFNPKFYIWKSEDYFTWELTLCDEFELDYPRVIGRITYGQCGSMEDTICLSWIILDDNYKGLGYAKAFLSTYLNHVNSGCKGFSVAIKKDNTPSYRLAEGCGFKLYDEDDEALYYIYEQR